MSQTILYMQDYLHMPWANNAGYSEEIAKNECASHAQGFDWRLGIDDEAQSGLLASFSGYTHIVSVLEGASINLVIDAQYENTLRTFEHAGYLGGSMTSGQLMTGPIRNLNLVYDHERYTGNLRWHELSEAQDFTTHAEVIMVFSAIDQLLVTGATLKRYETLLIKGNSGTKQMVIESPTHSSSDHCCIIELHRNS